MGCKIDIVIVADSSNSVHSNGNEQNMVAFIKDFIASFSTELNADDVRIGLVHFDAGPQCSWNSLSGESPLYLTSDQVILEDWADTTYTLGVQPGNSNTMPPGTDIVGGVWMGLNLLYGNNSRLGVQKKLITIFDGPHFLDYSDIECGQYLGANSEIYHPFTGASLNAAAIFNPLAVNQGYSSHQLIKNIPNCPADYDSGGTVLGNTSWQAGHSSDVWFQTRIINNNLFNDLKTYAVFMHDGLFTPNSTYHFYAEQWAHPGNMHYGSFGGIVPPGGSTTTDIVLNIRANACDEVLPTGPVDPDFETQVGPDCHKIDKAWHIYACPCDWTPKLINTQYSGVVTDLHATPQIVGATYDALAGKAYSKDIWYCENNDTGQTEVAMDYPLSQIDGWQPQVGDKFHGCSPGVECFEYNSNQIDNGGVWTGCSGYPSSITNTASDVLKIFFIDQSAYSDLQGQVPRSQYVMPDYPGNVISTPNIGQADWVSYPVRNFKSTKRACGETEPYPYNQSLRTTIEITETDSLNILLKNFGLSSANEDSEFLNHTLVRLPDPTAGNPWCTFGLTSPCVMATQLYLQPLLDLPTFMNNMDIHFNNVANGWPNATWGGCAWFHNRTQIWEAQLLGMYQGPYGGGGDFGNVSQSNPVHVAQKTAKIAWAECMKVHCCHFEPDPSGGRLMDPNITVDTGSVEYMDDPLPRGDDISHTGSDFPDQITKY